MWKVQKIDSELNNIFLSPASLQLCIEQIVLSDFIYHLVSQEQTKLRN
jgi:hypothetical protein